MVEVAADEARLVRRARAGDAAAFAALVRRHEAAVLRLAGRMVGPDAAEDVLQQALLKAWRGLAGFAGGAAFGTWLYRIVANACLDHRRRALHAVETVSPTRLDEACALADPAADPAEALAELAERRDRLAAVVWAWGEVPESDRRLLRAHLGDGRGYAELASELGVAPATVGTRLHRARARLRRLAITRLAPALAAALLALALLAQPEALADVGLWLRSVVLRETAPPAQPTALVPLRRVSFAEAQAQVPWPVLRPTYLPDGYALAAVHVGAMHAFADGPTVILDYARGDAHLHVLEVRASAPAVEDVAPGAARTVRMSSSTALVIDGHWAERDGRRVWESGTMLRVIVQRGELVVQLQADPRDGWWDRRLVELAESLR
jgi:RNA polymerase sigma-70 factor (ECF subfamily)